MIGHGGHDEHGKDALRTAVTRAIARPLAEYGIVLDADALRALVND